MEQLINFIIRPPRAEYNPKNDLLDPEFMLKGKWYHRKDMEVINSRGDILQCSHYMPVVPPEGKTLPCVIYCHGNSGCRTDASEAAIILLPLNITVFTLDFSGSGLSGGDYVTLGWNEKDDLRAVVDYLRADGNVSLIGLWGRSMGAVTCLMYGAEDPSIAGMVLDSPFSDLVDLMMELVDTYKVRIPKFTVKFAIQFMRRAIQKKAKFDISDLNTIKVAKSSFVPVLFGHAIEDDFIHPHHSDRIFDAYVGDKNIIKFEGDHNSPRPQFYFDSISIFFNNVLQPPEDNIGTTSYFDLGHDYFDKDTWSSIHDLEPLPELSGSPAGSGTAGSAEDAIKQLRSRRPMSSIVVPSDISSKESKEKQHDGWLESRGSDSHASSSNMISFELADGSPAASHLPASLDDDEYVEYPLDTLANFPSNVEEEERMLMVAILESLKDSDVETPSILESSPDGANSVPEHEPAPRNEQEGFLSSQSKSVKPESVSSSGTQEIKPVSQTLDLPKFTSSSELDTRDSSSNHSLPNIHVNNSKNILTAEKVPVPAASTSIERKTSCSASQDNNQNSSEVDLVDRTTVTVKVEKSPSSNIMDGLLRRWDLFKNR